VTRRPWQRGKGWSPEEIAAELQRCRAALVAELHWKSVARSVPVGVQEEVISDAMAAVVMDSRPILGEEHLLGAFWLAVENRLRRYHEGRYWSRLGSRERIQFDAEIIEPSTVTDGGLGQVELVDRVRRAADWFANLDERERQVLSVMASYDVGVVPASRLLGLPLGEVRAASRSAQAKLDQVAAITAAGRMCGYRYSAIAADAEGRASEREARLAKTHVSACVSCRRVYRRLRREMRGSEFQRAAAAAFLPLPAAPLAHADGAGKLAAWVEGRLPFLPRGSGERAAEVLGGAGVVKATVAGTAIVAATATFATHTLSSLQASHVRHHHRHVATDATPAGPRLAVRPFAAASTSMAAAASIPPPAPAPRHPHRTLAARRLPHTLGYLAIGGSAPPPRAVAVASSASASRQGSSTSSASSSGPTGHAASTQTKSPGRFDYLGP
jgi:hypothetical protein